MEPSPSSSPPCGPFKAGETKASISDATCSLASLTDIVIGPMGPPSPSPLRAESRVPCRVVANHRSRQVDRQARHRRAMQRRKVKQRQCPRTSMPPRLDFGTLLRATCSGARWLRPCPQRGTADSLTCRQTSLWPQRRCGEHGDGDGGDGDASCDARSVRPTPTAHLCSCLGQEPERMRRRQRWTAAPQRKGTWSWS